MGAWMGVWMGAGTGAGMGSGTGSVAAVGVGAPRVGTRATHASSAVALVVVPVLRGRASEEEKYEQDDGEDLPASVDALGADEHGVAEQQLRLLGRNNALRGGGRHGHLRGRGLGVGLVLRGRDGRVAVGRGHGGGRYGCLTLRA